MITDKAANERYRFSDDGFHKWEWILGKRKCWLPFRVVIFGKKEGELMETGQWRRFHPLERRRNMGGKERERDREAQYLLLTAFQ
jgi:hypothetical protein